MDHPLNAFICSIFLQNAAATQVDGRRKTVAFPEIDAPRTLGCDIATMKMRTWMAALLLGCAGMTVEAQAPATDVNVADVLGHNLGDKFTRHHKVVDVMTHLAEARPHWQLEHYGTTTEGRPLLGLIMSSEENMANLGALREANRRRVAEGVDSGDRVVWVYLSYNVHGNEAVCTEAAMATAEALATTHSHLLERAVVVMDPCVNPDGRDRYVHFQDQSTSPRPNADPYAWEHDEPWPGGRPNHYLFDMNRDLAWQTQRETQARTAFYQAWMPQVHVDFHEQGVNSPYYFAPAAEPYHKIVSPWQRECQGHIGRNNAKYFDQRGALYFTREVFDLLYPAYGDTWPMFRGAVGMTYEQGGSGRAGRAVKTAVGDTLTLAYRIQNHTESGLSTVEASAAHADRMLKEFAAYHRRNAQEPWGDFASYVIPRSNDPAKVTWLTDLMNANGIECHTATKATKTSGLDYRTMATTKVYVQPGDLVLDAHQPMSSLLQVLMDPNPELSDSLTYDITTWALPYVYGLEAYALPTRLTSLEPWSCEPTDGMPALEVQEAPAYAYLVSYHTDAGTPALAAMLKHGLTVRVAKRPIDVGGVVHPRGTLVVTRRNNEAHWDGIEGHLSDWTQRPGMEVTRLESGMVDGGPDLGAYDVRPIDAPHVSVVMGDEVSSLSFGEVWHLFEEVWEYPMTAVRGLDAVHWESTDVVVLPRGWYSAGDDMKGQIADWVRDGGRLIALDGACNLGLNEWGLTRFDDDADKQIRADERDAHDASDRYAPYALSDRNGIQSDIPGAVYEIQLDPTHPLAYGYGDRYWSIKTSGRRYAHLADGHNVGIVAGAAAPVSGFAGHRANAQLRESLSFGVHDMGRGHVIYLADNVLFRAFWKDGHKFFANAVFFSAAM